MLSISVDSVFSHKAFAEKCGGLNFPMLSDFYPHGEVAKLYGVLGERGFNKRSVFIIDRGGTIRFSKVYEKGVPENAELLAELDKVAR